MLSGYWQTDMDPKLRAAVLADWADELEDWPMSQIRWGLREWRRSNPRRKPNPGDILGVLKAQRGKAAAAKVAELTKPSETPKPQIDEETRLRQQAEIQAMLAGFARGGEASA